MIQAKSEDLSQNEVEEILSVMGYDYQNMPSEEVPIPDEHELYTNFIQDCVEF